MNEMILSVKECENTNLLKGKLTVVIETFDRPLDRLMQTIFSLLLRSKGSDDLLHHIIVCINGPDVRTGSVELQDIKDLFLSELRNLKWQGRDMPITVIRVWSRVGRGHSLQMAMPWIHTEYYAIVEDNLLTKNCDWVDEVKQVMGEGVDLLNMRPVSNAGVGISNNVQLHLPRIGSSFLVARKDNTQEHGINWLCYFVHGRNFKVTDEFLEYTKKTNSFDPKDINKDREFHHLVVETGAWLRYIVDDKGLKLQDSKACYTEQLFDISWWKDAALINELEQELRQHDGYYELYNKYKLKIKKLDFTHLEIDPNVNTLVCVVVYNRKNTIHQWLRAWNNAEKFGAKIAVIHNYDGPKPPDDEKENILKHKPDYYLPRPNCGWDLGAFQDMLTEKRVDFDWNVLVWFADDCIPMRRDFVKPFISKIGKSEVGMIGQCSEGAYVRTNAFAIKKEVMSKLVFKEGGGKIVNREDCLKLENTMMKQVEGLGYKVELTMDFKHGSPDYIHWSVYSSEWLWDCGHLSWWDLWGKFEEQFDNMKVNVISPGNLPTTTFIIVYDRVDNLERWLHAWSKTGAGKVSNLGVVHNFNNDPATIKKIKDLVQEYKVNYYVERPSNRGRDIGAFQDVVLGLSEFGKLESFGWFTDDFLPMTNDFIEPFLSKISNPKTGIVGACFEPYNQNNCFDHIRTVGFFIRSDVARKLKFPAHPVTSRNEAFEFEHGAENMTKQIIDMGYEIALAIGPNYPISGYSHWPNNSKFMIDVSMFSNFVSKFDEVWEVKQCTNT